MLGFLIAAAVYPTAAITLMIVLAMYYKDK